MIAVSKAKSLLMQTLQKSKTSEVNLTAGLNLILSEDVYSPIDVPSFDNSAMDGYALKFSEGNMVWKLHGEIQAGDTSNYKLRSGEATRIFTGAKLPEGADTVIQQELVRLEGEDVIYDHHKISTGNNVRLKGSQCQAGDQILKRGTRVTSGVTGLLASVGISKIRCFVSPVVAYIVTGNELKEVGQPLESGEIYNSNGPMLNALLKETGIDNIISLKAEDDKEHLQRAINKALKDADVVILSGGISVGEYDFVKECLANSGVESIFYKIKQRPGKPMYAGTKGEKTVFALPGNPASVLSCYIQYVKPYLQSIMGKEDAWLASRSLPLLEDVKKKKGFTFFMKAKKEDEGVRILTGQESFNLQAFSTADCLVELEEDDEIVPKGTVVKIYDL